MRISARAYRLALQAGLILERELPSGVRKCAVRDIHESYAYLPERAIHSRIRRNRLNSDEPRGQASGPDTTHVTLARSATESFTTRQYAMASHKIVLSDIGANPAEHADEESSD